jgi:hypothetical protein
MENDMIKAILAILSLAFLIGCPHRVDMRGRDVKISSPDEIQHCEYIDDVDASRDKLSNAKKAVRINASRLGATHLVWDERYLPNTGGDNSVNVNIGRGAGEYYINAKVYKCE